MIDGAEVAPAVAAVASGMLPGEAATAEGSVAVGVAPVDYEDRWQQAQLAFVDDPRLEEDGASPAATSGL